MMGRSVRKMKSDRGATSVEYALMAGLIAVVIAGTVATVGQAVAQLFVIPGF